MAKKENNNNYCNRLHNVSGTAEHGVVIIVHEHCLKLNLWSTVLTLPSTTVAVGISIHKSFKLPMWARRYWDRKNLLRNRSISNSSQFSAYHFSCGSPELNAKSHILSFIKLAPMISYSFISKHSLSIDWLHLNDVVYAHLAVALGNNKNNEIE